MLQFHFLPVRSAVKNDRHADRSMVLQGPLEWGMGAGPVSAVLLAFVLVVGWGMDFEWAAEIGLALD